MAHLIEDSFPMSVLKVFAAQGFDQFRVIDHILNFLRESQQNVIFLILLHFHLHLDVLCLIAVDLLDNLLGILISKGIHVPLLLLFGEGITIVPQCVALLILSFEDLKLGNVGMLHVENLLVLLVLFNLREV